MKLEVTVGPPWDGGRPGSPTTYGVGRQVNADGVPTVLGYFQCLSLNVIRIVLVNSTSSSI